MKHILEVILERFFPHLDDNEAYFRDHTGTHTIYRFQFFLVILNILEHTFLQHIIIAFAISSCISSCC